VGMPLMGDPLREECMLVNWIFHALLLSGILTGAAMALSSALRMAGAPARGVWALALLGSFLLPIRSAVWAPGRGGVVESGAGFPFLSSPDLQAALARLDGPILLLWALASAFLLLRSIFGFLRLRELRENWQEHQLAGLPVLVSRTVGPAVVGVHRGRIVLPQWVLRREPEIQELILAHEGEHLRARDALLVACGGGLLLLTPWNPFLWIQLRSLRSAVELDCDRRVLLARPASRLTYGELLLEVGALRSPRLGVPRLAGRRSTLERRIEFLVQDPRSIAPEGLLRSSWGAVLALLAFLVPVPPVPLFELPYLLPSGPLAIVSGGGGVVDALRERPIFTPHSQPPSLRNDSSMRQAVDREYPSDLRNAGVGGKVLLHVLIDNGGVVQEARLALGSGQEALDAAAIRAVRRLSFWPALERDRATPAWISLPIIFYGLECPPVPGLSPVGGPRSMDGPPSPLPLPAQGMTV
jgi:TonB family protein